MVLLVAGSDRSDFDKVHLAFHCLRLGGLRHPRQRFAVHEYPL
jgi:hypothetical protein